MGKTRVATKSSGRSSSLSSTERTPLLASTSAILHGRNASPPSPEVREQAESTAWKRRTVLTLICICIVAADFGSSVSYAPQLEILESIICRQMYGSSIIGNGTSSCKSPEVQGELALLNGWKDTFDKVPGIALGLPCGLLADRVGRKPVLVLCLIGLILEEIALRLVCWWSDMVPLKAVWLTPVFQILGGGPEIATSMAYAMITDVFPTDKRSSIFFFLAAIILIGEIFASPIGAALMSWWSPWLPSLIGVLCQVAGLTAALALPETRSPVASSRSRSDGHIETAPLVNDVDDDDNVPNKTNWADTVGQWPRQLRAMATHRSWPLPVVNSNIIFVAAAFLLGSIGRQALQLVIQYASHRFGWTIARASVLISLKGTVNLVALLVILPWLAARLDRRMNPTRKDLLISQGSAALLTFGAILMAVAARPEVFIAGVIVLALGWGFYSALRSVATALVAPEQVALLNTVIAMAQGVGGLVAGPVLAAAFRRGMVLGGAWAGLPYGLAALLFMGASCLVCNVRIVRREAPSAPEEGDNVDGRSGSDA